MKQREIILSRILVAVCLLALAACGPTRDPETISKLESARDQIFTLYDSFTGSQGDDDQVEIVRAQLESIRGYEAAKGRANELMVKQMDAILTLYDNHIADRKAKARWSGAHKNNKKEIIGEAIKIAIATENEKNS